MPPAYLFLLVLAVFFFAAAFFLGLALFFTCSGSSALPVSRFHSSNVSGEIFPLTSSSANLRRWARLLNGIPGTSASLLWWLIDRLSVLIALLRRCLGPLESALPLGLLLLLPAYFLLPLLKPIVTLWQDDSSEDGSDYASGLVPVMWIRVASGDRLSK
jgi:hypothetical protein